LCNIFLETEAEEFEVFAKNEDPVDLIAANKKMLNFKMMELQICRNHILVGNET